MSYMKFARGCRNWALITERVCVCVSSITVDGPSHTRVYSGTVGLKGDLRASCSVELFDMHIHA